MLGLRGSGRGRALDPGNPGCPSQWEPGRSSTRRGFWSVDPSCSTCVMLACRLGNAPSPAGKQRRTSRRVRAARSECVGHGQRVRRGWPVGDSSEPLRHPRVSDWVGKNTDIVAPLVTAVVAGTAAFKGMSAAMGAVNAVKAAGGRRSSSKQRNLAKAAHRGRVQLRDEYEPDRRDRHGDLRTRRGPRLLLHADGRQAGRHGRRSLRPSTAPWTDQIRVVVRHGVHLRGGRAPGTASRLFDLRRAAPTRRGEAITAVWDGIVDGPQDSIAIIVGIVLNPSSPTFRHG